MNEHQECSWNHKNRISLHFELIQKYQQNPREKAYLWWGNSIYVSVLFCILFIFIQTPNI